MKYRSPRTAKFLLDGAARIIAAPDMGRTWQAIDAGSMASDWNAIGNDLRQSMRLRDQRAVG